MNLRKTGEQHDEDAQKIGIELSKQLKKSIESIPDALSLFENDRIFSLKDIDEKKLIRELTILTYVGQRLAIQLMERKRGGRDVKRRREICDALDRHASEFLEDSPEFYDLLDKRGEQYFQLLQSHNIEGADNLEKYVQALQVEFEQFCRGGGGEDDPFFIGGFTSMMPLRQLAFQYWLNGFIKTFEFLKTQEPL